MKSVLYTAIIVLTSVGPALAGQENGTVRLPEPTTLALLSAGFAAVTLGTRWFRRK